jgi:hypothetical protein
VERAVRQHDRPLDILLVLFANFRGPVRLFKLFEALSLRPGVPLAGFRVDLLVSFRVFEEIRMVLLEADPLDFPLEEAEVATGARPPSRSRLP